MGAQNGSTIDVRLTPRGGRDDVEGPTPDGVLRVRVAASPVDGAANRALLRLVANALGVPPSRVALVAGHAGRHKRIALEGVEAATVAARWPGVRIVPDRVPDDPTGRAGSPGRARARSRP